MVDGGCDGVGGGGDGGEVGGDGCKLVEMVKMMMLMEKVLVKKERGGEEEGLSELSGREGGGSPVVRRRWHWIEGRRRRQLRKK